MKLIYGSKCNVQDFLEPYEVDGFELIKIKEEYRDTLSKFDQMMLYEFPSEDTLREWFNENTIGYHHTSEGGVIGIAICEVGTGEIEEVELSDDLKEVDRYLSDLGLEDGKYFLDGSL